MISMKCSGESDSFKFNKLSADFDIHVIVPFMFSSVTISTIDCEELLLQICLQSHTLLK